MAANGQVSPSLIKKLCAAAEAASAFSLACKRGLSTMVDNNSSQSFSVLNEEDLITWREASEPLTKALPQDQGYFISRNLFQKEDASCLAQVDAVNLAFVLEMFLPIEVREQYPRWTNRVPLIDEEADRSDGKVLKRQILDFTRPLNELKSVYLCLCAGRKEKHITYILRGILLDLCATTAVVVKNAQGKTAYKPEDLVPRFEVDFLRDPSLVPTVFATRAIQNKAIATWRSEGGARLQKLQEKPESGEKYTWEDLCEVFLRDALKNLVPSIFERAKAERVHIPNIPKGSKKTGNNEILSADLTTTRSKTPIIAGPAAASLPSAPMPPKPNQATEVNSAVADTPRVLPTSVSHPSTPTTQNGNPAPQPQSEPFPLFPNDTGPDMMEYVQDMGGSEDGEGEDVAPVEPSLPRAPSPVRERKIPRDFRFNVRQANATKVHMTPSPSPVRSPSPPAGGGRANSMLRKIKKTMTADNDRNRTISTSTNRSKDSSNAVAVSKAKVTARQDPFIDILNNMEEEAENVIGRKTTETKKKKRKANEEDEGEAARHAKKRKVGDMPPPTAASRPTETTSTVPERPYAARHSTASSATLVNPSELAGPSNLRMPPAQPSTSTTASKPKRNIVMAAESSSDSDADLGSRARKIAQKRSRLYTRGKKANPTIDEHPEEFPPARPTTSARGPISLTANDRRLMDSKARMAEIRAIAEREKKKDAEFAEEEAKSKKERKKGGNAKDDSETETDSDEEYQDARSHASDDEESVDSAEAVRRSNARLAEIKKEAEKHKGAVQRRAKHLPIATDEEEEEEPEPKQKKRGRPRKVIPESSEEEEVPAPPKKNKYATGGNTTGGRVRWTEEEDKTLMFAVEALYYGGNLLKPWAQVLDRHGPNGKDDQKLAGRNCVQLKDRARNIARKYAAQGKEIPVFLQWIKLSEKPAK